jgi:DNA-binding transcriptional MerR regulator
MTTKALRYYERVGLLPEPDRIDSGYRDYGDTVFDRLRFIRAAQAVGLTLGEIRGGTEAGELTKQINRLARWPDDSQ